MIELIALYKLKAAGCRQSDCRDWWLAKAYALEQVIGIGKRPPSRGAETDKDEPNE